MYLVKSEVKMIEELLKHVIHSFIFLNSLHICCYLEISYGASKENLFENQEFLKLVIIFFILMTLKFDSGVIL